MTYLRVPGVTHAVSFDGVNAADLADAVDDAFSSGRVARFNDPTAQVVINFRSAAAVEIVPDLPAGTPSVPGDVSALD